MNTIYKLFFLTLALLVVPHAKASASNKLAMVPASLPSMAIHSPPELAPLSATHLSFQWQQSTPNQARIVGLATAQLALQYGALLALQPPNWQDHGNSLTPSWAKLSSNFTVAPVWKPKELGGGGHLGYLQADGDAWQTNVIGHGLQGSEVYLRMRQESYGMGAAFAAGVVHSTVWEYLVEGWNETPSTWDLVYTPIGGAIIGELRYLAARSLDAYDDTMLGWGLLAIIDPIGVTF